MDNKYKKIVPFVVMIVLIFGIGGYFIYKNLESDKINKVTTTKDIDNYIDTDDGDEDIDWTKYEEYNITSGDSVTIKNAGIYILSGTITETITINTTDNVKLILNNVIIKPSSGAGIVVEEADNVVIYLNDGTTNTIEDNSTYSYDDTDINGAIYAKDDLIFDGSGTLNIIANYQDGIVSKDDLKIINGVFNIEANDDGIRGKDSVYIVDGTFNITAGGDGIKSTNDTEDDKGYILVENGTFNITAELDGLQAETKLVINNGIFDITTGGGSSNSNSSSSNWGNWGRMSGTNNSTLTTTASAKGLKAVSNLVISNGTFNLDTSDDAIHSNNYVGITDGVFNISSGDDGIHADTKLIVDGGNIKISKSYEGLESAAITINGGNIEVVASDDGINVAGGNDESGMNRPGENNYNSNSNNILTINNGYIYVDAVGDGIDVNGSAYVYGGEIYVDGPIDNGNGILDYDREFVVDGGVLVGAGSNGMLQSVSSNKQYNVTISFSSNYEADSKVQIIDSNGNEVISYQPSKKFSAIIISSELLEGSKTYTVKVNGTVYKTFTTSTLSSSVGTNGGMMQGGNPRR